MPSKRYRLKLDHPYAKAGTIVEEYGRRADAFMEFKVVYKGLTLYMPIPVEDEHTWLEEVKEEVMFTKEQNSALRQQLLTRMSMFESFFVWLDSHTSKEE